MMRDPDLILGLDGGGTKTLVALADRDGFIHHLTRYPSLDPFAHHDWAERMRAIWAELDRFQPRLARAVLGMPCHGEVARLSEDQRSVARAVLDAPHEVINDVEAAFDGALAGAPGVLLLAGTGSMAWAGDGHRTMRCGGWGDMFGDEGSAHWIGREALAETSRALDGRSSHDGFAQALLAHLGLTPDGLVGWCYDLPARRAAIADLAQFTDAQAAEGDAAAKAIMTSAADALVLHAEACARQLDLPHPLAWSHAGSVFRSRMVMARIIERLGTEPLAPQLPPVGGALLRAARRAGWPVNKSWIERLSHALSDRESRIAAV